mmetsp:Transcript_119974/g.311414  ORF Transcript_119974/g.311414 Transcript_119974/m.311414 type:complete len:101 (-) Transcript_119974:1225-1527(-)
MAFVQNPHSRTFRLIFTNMKKVIVRSHAPSWISAKSKHPKWLLTTKILKLKSRWKRNWQSNWQRVQILLGVIMNTNTKMAAIPTMKLVTQRSKAKLVTMT